MKLRSRVFVWSALFAGLYFLQCHPAGAQPLITLHNFSLRAGTYATNSDGAVPRVPPVLSGGVLYGTTSAGGLAGNGAIFRVNANGTSFTNLHSFSSATYNPTSGYDTNYDGTGPEGLILSGNTLFGVAGAGGSGGSGTVFKIETDGTGFTVLHAFTTPDPNNLTNSDGAYPSGTLALGGGTLYGTTAAGGEGYADGEGTVFALSTNGGPVTRLVDFSDVYPYSTNGTTPYGLTLSGGTLYGVTEYGGASAAVDFTGSGTVFKLSTNNGTGFLTLHSFSRVYGSGNYNSDGATPRAGVVIFGNTVYGVAAAGGSSGEGTIFAVSTNGAGFTNLHTFSALSSNTNADGAQPTGLIDANGNLYGTTLIGGSGRGTVFELTNGSGFDILYTFTPLNYTLLNGVLAQTNTDGASPSGLVWTGNNLYGSAIEGGNWADGTVFSLVLPGTSPIPLNIASVGKAVVLSWTNPFFSLQASPSLTDTFTTISDSVSPYTNPISAPQEFFRLVAP